jgi:hypothetical protein
MAELSYEEVVGIFGSLGDVIIAEIIATGINKEGLEAARARVVRDRKAHNPGPPLEPGPCSGRRHSGAIARARDIGRSWFDHGMSAIAGNIHRNSGIRARTLATSLKSVRTCVFLA